MSDTPDVVSVHLTQQQIELLERLKQKRLFRGRNTQKFF